MVTTLELRPWVPIDDVEHTKTSWEFASDVDFEDIVDSSYEDEVNLNIFYSFIDIPIGVKYYGRAKRHFSDDTESDWTQPKVIEVFEDELNTTLPLDISVDVPIIYVDKDEVLHNDSFTIKTSKFRGKNDGHHSTSWIIKDDRGNVIFRSMQDKDNKTSITVNKSDLTHVMFDRITILAIHNTLLGVESSVGKKEIVLYDVNFDVVSNVNNIMPYRDYELVLKKKITTNVTGIFRIELLNMKNELIYTKDFNTDVTNIIIPGGILNNNSEYILDIYVNITESTINAKRILLHTIEVGDNDVINPEYVYNKTVEYLHDVSSPLLEYGCSVKELTSGLIPFIEDEEQGYRVKFNRDTLRMEDDVELTGLNLDNSDNDNTFIKILNNNTVIVDTKNDDGDPTFKIFNYNPVNESMELVQTKTRDDEVDPIGKTNALVVLDNDNFIYMPTNSGKLIKYNIPDNELTELAMVPNKDMKDGVIFYIGSNRIMILGGSENSGYSYNINNKTFLETMKIEKRFSDRPLKVIQLINNDYLIVRTTEKDEDENGDIMYYDTNNDRISVVPIANEIIPYFDSSLTLVTGEIVLIENKDDANKYFLFK